MSREDELGYWSTWRPSRRRLLRGASVGMVLGLAGCGTPAAQVVPPTVAPPAGAPAAAATAVPTAVLLKRGGVFRMGAAATWATLDPHTSTNPNTFAWGVGHWYSRLLKLRLKDVQLPAFIPVGDVAESWQQPDNLTYVFKLRPNVKFQNLPPVNGRPLTAEDVVYSYERQRTKGFANASLLDALAKAEAVDKLTPKLTISAPSADFLISVAAPQSPILAKETVEAAGGELKEGPLVGSGAFILEKAVKNGTSTLHRNPDYFLPGLPYLDGFEFIDVPDLATQLAAIRAGQLDALPPASATYKDMEALKQTNPKIIVQDAKALSSGLQLGMRQDRAPFSDIRVRQAIYKALDAQTIIDTAYGSGWLTVGLALPSLEWVLPEAEMAGYFKRDLEGAKRLLKEAGLENGAEFSLATHNTLPGLTAAELVAAQLKEAGVRATLKPLDSATYFDQLQRSEFEAYFGNPVGTDSTADGILFGKYHSKGSRNNTKINDPKLDQMIEQQTQLGRDLEARKKVLLDIQRHILQQGYLHQIVTYILPAVQQPYVRDYYPGLGYINLETERYTLAWFDK
jgi:ABC-type transport system substrate-binding protein